jgi:hypothetical protein
MQLACSLRADLISFNGLIKERVRKLCTIYLLNDIAVDFFDYLLGIACDVSSTLSI